MIRNEENMDELLSKFFDKEQVSEIGRDIRLGDELLRSHTSPKPDFGMIEQIKADIQSRLVRGRGSMRLLFRKVAVAAMIICLAFASIRFIKQETEPASVPGGWAHIWDDIDTGSDSQLVSLRAEVEDIAERISDTRLDEYNGEQESYLIELEMELENNVVETNVDFWKG